MRIFFQCDAKKDCWVSELCQKECFHTRDKDHAVARERRSMVADENGDFWEIFEAGSRQVAQKVADGESSSHG